MQGLLKSSSKNFSNLINLLTPLASCNLFLSFQLVQIPTVPLFGGVQGFGVFYLSHLPRLNRTYFKIAILGRSRHPREVGGPF